MKKLIEGWKQTHCGFEIVESIRKVCSHPRTVAFHFAFTFTHAHMTLALALHPSSYPYNASTSQVAIVGAPVFFDPAGSSAQLIFGLLVSFIFGLVYAYEQPYAKPSHNSLALLCQTQTFFAILSALSLNVNFDGGGSTATIDGLLSAITFVPMALALALVFPSTERLFIPSERAKLTAVFRNRERVRHRV